MLMMSRQEMEAECFNPHSTFLKDMALALLKFVSSHRGLTYVPCRLGFLTCTDRTSNDIFDEYARRQYQSKVPHKPNPFGMEESPAKFAEFDIFTKVGWTNKEYGPG